MQSLLKIISGERNGLWANCVRLALWILSKPYGVIVRLRGWAYQRRIFKIHSVEAPVISVGNLTVGGTGKTPTVAWLAKWFRQKDIRVCIISRGFESDISGSNDEAKELEQKLPDVPHLQNANRVSAAQTAIYELESQLLVLDDGFQHRRIDRNLNIVLLDALAPFGFGHVLPRGLLREPLGEIRRADIVIVTRTDQVTTNTLADIRSKVQRYAPKAAWVESTHRPSQLRNSTSEFANLDIIRNKNVFVFSGIGNPTGFSKTVESLGATILQHQIFPDHHHYTRDDVKTLELKISENESIEYVLCTAKDLVKISVGELGGRSLFAVDIELSIEHGIEGLEDHLTAVAATINSI